MKSTVTTSRPPPGHSHYGSTGSASSTECWPITAILAGTLRAVVQPGLYENTTFYPGVVTTVCGCIGMFDRIVSSSIFFNATAAIDTFGDSVDLTLVRIPFGDVPGLTVNQRNVGNALELSYSTALTGNLATFYGNLLASTSAGVLDQISGEGTTGTQTAAFSAATMFNSVLMGQVTYWKNGGQAGLASPPMRRSLTLRPSRASIPPSRRSR